MQNRSQHGIRSPFWYKLKSVSSLSKHRYSSHCFWDRLSHRRVNIRADLSWRAAAGESTHFTQMVMTSTLCLARSPLDLLEQTLKKAKQPRMFKTFVGGVRPKKCNDVSTGCAGTRVIGRFVDFTFGCVEQCKHLCGGTNKRLCLAEQNRYEDVPTLSDDTLCELVCSSVAKPL